MQNSNIVIFSRAIRSGKTTELLLFANNNRCVAGILTPDDEEGRRILYDISAKQSHEFELAPDSDAESVTIGRFLFSAQAFKKGKAIILGENEADCLIVDEIGKLEIRRDEGFEPEIGLLISAYQENRRKGILLLVIRDSLLVPATEKYGLQNAEVINTLEHLSFFKHQNGGNRPAG